MTLFRVLLYSVTGFPFPTLHLVYFGVRGTEPHSPMCKERQAPWAARSRPDSPLSRSLWCIQTILDGSWIQTIQDSSPGIKATRPSCHLWGCHPNLPGAPLLLTWQRSWSSGALREAPGWLERKIVTPDAPRSARTPPINSQVCS